LNKLLAVKICIQDDSPDSPVTNEVKMLQRLGDFKRRGDRPGLDFTRLAIDIFQLRGQFGSHYCITSDLQGNSLCALQRMLPNAVLPNRSIKSLVHRLLFSVDWLHDTCGTIHTGEPACCYLAVLDSYTHTRRHFPTKSPPHVCWSVELRGYLRRKALQSRSSRKIRCQ
jgi:hypothetical protein